MQVSLIIPVEPDPEQDYTSIINMAARHGITVSVKPENYLELYGEVENLFWFGMNWGARLGNMGRALDAGTLLSRRLDNGG
jgi:hypothetical protein